MGEAIAKRLARAGATVATTARSATPGAPASDLFIQADLSTAEDAEKVVREVLARLGGVDILINNVGGSTAPGGGFAALTDNDWLSALNGNLLCAVRLDRGLLPGMLERGAGVIIHISSIQRSLPLYESPPRLRGGQGCIDQLQQGPLQRSRTPRCACELRRPWLHRDHGR